MRRIVTTDVGGTHARFALAEIAAGKVTLGVYPEPAKSELLRYESTDRPDDKAVSRKSLKGFC